MDPVLQAGQTPQPGQRYKLYETFSEGVSIVSDPFRVTVSADGTVNESRVSDGPMVIRGVFQRADVPNANKRIYPRSLWEKQLNEKSPLMARIAHRAAIGEIEHPKDGVGSLKESAIVTTKVWMQPDGTVLGEAEVLDTPAGAVVRGLLRSGVRVGISSRGTGTVKPDGTVDEATYNCETWDIVGNPSTPGAYPTLTPVPAAGRGRIGESTIFRVQGNQMSVTSVVEGAARREIAAFQFGETHMGNTKDAFRSLSDALKVHIAASRDPLSERARESLAETLTTGNIQLGEMIQADPAIESLGRALQSDIIEALRRLNDTKPAEKPAAKPASESSHEDDEDEDEDDEDGKDDENGKDDKKNEATEKAAKGKDDKNEAADDDTADGEVRLDEAVTEDIVRIVGEMSEGDARTNLANLIATVMEADTFIESLHGQIQEQADIIESLVADNEALNEALNEAQDQAAAAAAIIQEQNADGGEDPIAEAVASLIERDGRLADFRIAMERCETVDEVKALATKLVKSFAPVAEGKGKQVIDSIVGKQPKNVSEGVEPSAADDGNGGNDLPPAFVKHLTRLIESASARPTPVSSGERTVGDK